MGCQPKQLGEVGGMRGVLLEWLKHFRTLAQVNKSKYSFTYVCTLDSKKLNSRRQYCFILFIQLNDHQTWSFNFGLR